MEIGLLLPCETGNKKLDLIDYIVLHLGELIYPDEEGNVYR